MATTSQHRKSLFSGFISHNFLENIEHLCSRNYLLVIQYWLSNFTMSWLWFFFKLPEYCSRYKLWNVSSLFWFQTIKIHFLFLPNKLQTCQEKFSLFYPELYLMIPFLGRAQTFSAQVINYPKGWKGFFGVGWLGIWPNILAKVWYTPSELSQCSYPQT